MANGQINVRKIISDSGFSSIRILLSLVRTIILIPVITNLLGVDSYGIWVAALAIISISVSVGSLHMKGSLIRYSSRGNTEQVFADVFWLTFLSGLVVSVGVAALSITTRLFDVLQRPKIGLAASVAIFTSILSRVALNYPRAQNRVKAYELLKTFHLLAETAVIVGVIYITESIVAGITALGLVTLLVTLLVLARYVNPFSFRPEISNFGRYLRYSIPMIPKSLSTSLLSNIDKYLVLLLLNPQAAGIYAVAFSLARLLDSFTSILNPTLYPAVTSAWDDGEQESLRKLYSAIFRWYSLVGIPAVVGLAVLSQPLLRLVSTVEVSNQGAYLVPLITFGFLFRGYDNPVAYIINAAEENQVLAKILLIATGANVVLNILLIPQLGLLGAVIATLVAQIFIAVAIIRFGRRQIPFPIPADKIVRTAIASILMGAALFWIPVSISWYYKLILYPVLGTMVFAVTALLVGAVSRDEIKRVRSKI